MAFTQHGSLDPHGAPVLVRRTIANSTEVSVGDSVKMDGGFAALGEATTNVLGHVSGISTESGVGLSTDGSTGAEFGTFAGTFTTASDNETAAQVKAEIDISKHTLYSAEVDATLGTTPGSDEDGAYFDLADEDTLDESTYSATAAQYQVSKRDPQESSQVIVNIFESSVFGA